MKKITNILLNATLVLSLFSSSLFAQNCSGFKTFTIGGWGAGCAGNNPGCYRDANFAAAFPNGLTIGCANGNTLTLTSAAAVEDFLPSGSTPSALPSGNMVDPGGNYNNVLAAQLVGVTLAEGFDAYDAGFSSNSLSLGSLKFASGTFAGMSVSNFLALANDIIGGCNTSAYSLSDFNAAATAINENYDNGTVDHGDLICESNLSVSITPSSINCHGEQNASVTSTVTGGTAPYTYSWSNGATTANLTNVGAGTYSLVVTDANGNSNDANDATVTITEPTAIVVSLSAGSILCNGNTTSISVSATGGVGNYSGTGSFTVGAGTYNYTVSDGNGCEASNSIVITQPDPLTASAVSTPILCNGGSSTITVSANGGTPAYTGTGNFTVTAGSYTYTVTDANGCEANTSEVVVSEPSTLTASASATPILCNGGNSTVTVSANGGTLTYTGTGNFTVTAGTYNYTVTDANGCSANASVSIGQPSLLVLNSTAVNVTCYGASNGSVTYLASGGTAPYTYSPSAQLTGLAPNTYKGNVTDANGCKASTSAVITQPAVLTAVMTSTNVTCFGGTGTATATVSGGTAPYTYTWNSNPAQYTATANLPVGSYSVSIKDAKGCTTIGSAQLSLLTCNGFTSITQGGWGALCSGGNWGCYLDANFLSTFPAGAQIGSNGRFIKLTSAAAVHSFLPSPGTPTALAVGTLTNPTNVKIKNTLAGQAMALTLSIGFDMAKPGFSPASGLLKDLLVASGSFSGMSVNQLLAEANKVLGGLSSSYTAANLTLALDNINRNYDNGTINLGYLACPCTSARLGFDIENEEANSTTMETESSIRSYPNPSSGNTTIEFNSANDSNVKIELFATNGQLVDRIFNSSVAGNQKMLVQYNVEKLENGVYFLRLTSNNNSLNTKFVIAK